MKKPTSNLSVAICAYNAVEYTRLLLESVRRHSKYDHEIVLYSDGSTDGTRAWLADQPDVRWVHNPKNEGICTAMNCASRMATREFLFFPNTDHVLAPGWDEALMARLGKRIVVSCQCIEPGIVPVAPIFHAEDCGSRWDEFDEALFHKAAAAVRKDRVTPGINYPYAISRALWDEVGGLDERFNPGPANDPDLFYRLHFAGATMVRAEDAIVYHFSGKSSRLAGEAGREHRTWHEVTELNEARFEEKWGERYQYANGGLPQPGPEARRRWEGRDAKPRIAEVTTPLRVMIDGRSVMPGMKGIGAYTLNLARALGRLDGRVQVHCSSDHVGFLAGRLGETGVTVQRASERPARIADVFHGPAFAVPAGLSIPSVVTIHDLIFELHPEWYPEPFVKHLSSTVRQSLASSVQVIAVSDRTRLDLVEHLGVDPAKVTRIYEALPEEFALDVASDADVRERYAGGNQFILSVGVQQRRKNAIGLVRAYAKLKRMRPTAERLVLVGGLQCEDPGLRDEIERLGIAADVSLTDAVADAELVALYRACTLLAYPSLYEGFGLPLLEAMATGAPVVCSNAGSLPEIASDAAILCPAGDDDAFARSMLEVLSDAGLRRTLVERGKKRVAEFSWERAAEATLGVYEKALKPTSIPVGASPAAAKSGIRLRIAVDARMLNFTRTGTGRYTRELLAALLPLGADEAEFVLIGPKEIGSDTLPDVGAVIEHVPAGAETLGDAAWEQFSMPSHLAGCDVLFAPTGIVPVGRPCPAIPVVHDLGFLDHPDHYDTRLRDHLTRWVVNSVQSADAIIAVSEFTRSRLTVRCGIAQDRVHVVHHGRPAWNGKPARKQNQAPYVLCVSSFEPNKNQSILVEAISLIRNQWPGTLVLAGRSGRTFESLWHLVGERRLQDRVRIVPDPSDEALQDLYRSATAFLFPSLYEGFGLPLVEAMAAGLPIVASKLTSCPEIVGDAGMLLDECTCEKFSDALLTLLRDESRAAALGKAAAERAQTFSWETAARRTLDVLIRCARKA